MCKYVHMHVPMCLCVCICMSVCLCVHVLLFPTPAPWADITSQLQQDSHSWAGRLPLLAVNWTWLQEETSVPSQVSSVKVKLLRLTFAAFQSLSLHFLPQAVP